MVLFVIHNPENDCQQKVKIKIPKMSSPGMSIGTATSPGMSTSIGNPCDFAFPARKARCEGDAGDGGDDAGDGDRRLTVVLSPATEFSELCWTPNS